MQWNNKFTYPKSMRSMVSGSRMYAVNQQKLPSVTSILQATQSEEKKASLANWKARVGAAEANRIKNDASSRGTSMHSHLEKYLLGQLNLELLEEENKSKKMADEIIEQGIKNKLSEIMGNGSPHCTIQGNMLEHVMLVECMRDKKLSLILNSPINQKKKSGLRTIIFN